MSGVPQQSSPAQPDRIPEALQKLLRALAPPPNQRPPMIGASPGYPRALPWTVSRTFQTRAYHRECPTGK